MNKEESMAVKGEATLGRETETNRGWSYDLTICWNNATTTEHVLSLSWADHESIAGGQVRPSVLASAAAEVILTTRLDAFSECNLPVRIDVSTIRRMIDGFDDAVRPRLG